MKNDETLQAALAKVTLYKVDAEKGEGPQLAETFDVHSYPTFAVVNTDGAESDRWVGYDTPENWIKVSDQARADLRSIPDKKKAYAQKPNLALAKSLSRYSLATGDNVAAVDYLRTSKKLDSDAEARARYDQALLQAMAGGAKKGDFTTAEVMAQADVVIAAPDVADKTMLETAYFVGTVARQAEDMSLYSPYLAKAFTASKGSEDEMVQKYRGYLEADHALYVEKDEDKAINIKKSGMAEGWQEDPKQLNSFAWWCYENDLNLEEAEDLALKGVRLATDEGERANILDTAAEICNARGDCSKAVQLIREAIELDPDREYFQDQLARFESLQAAKG